MLTFFVPGTPRPKGSWTAIQDKRTKKIRFISKCKGLHEWARAVKEAAQEKYQGKPSKVAISLNLAFFVPRGKTVKRPLPIVKPDLDKLERTILDALTGVFYVDDSQVININSKKRYASEKFEAGVLIGIQKLKGE